MANWISCKDIWTVENVHCLLLLHHGYLALPITEKQAKWAKKKEREVGLHFDEKIRLNADQRCPDCRSG